MGRPPIPESSKRKQVCPMGPNKGRAIDRLVAEFAAREGAVAATSAIAPNRAV